jgi:hypothetical protein
MIGSKRKRNEEPADQGQKPAPALIGFRVVYVFERLSRDLWSRFYALDVARDAPQCSRRWKPYHRSIQLPRATIAGNGGMLSPLQLLPSATCRILRE